MKNALVIFGGDGYCFKQYYNPEFEILRPYRVEVDITDFSQVWDYLLSKNGQYSEVCVINAAAFTNVDEAESQRNVMLEDCWQTNVEGALNVAHAANKLGFYNLFISTDFIFPGTVQHKGPYPELEKLQNDKAIFKNIGWYAWTKLQAEIQIAENKYNTVVVRISYPNLLDKIVSNLKSANPYPLYSDQFLTPTTLADLYKAVDVLLSRKLIGIYHVATQKVTTPFEIGMCAARILCLQNLKSSSFQSKTPRPQFGGLSSEISQKILNIKFQTVQEALIALKT